MSSISVIQITHQHGDHFYGQFGLLSTLETIGHRTGIVYVVGPPGIRDMIKQLIQDIDTEHPSKLNINIQEVSTDEPTNIDTISKYLQMSVISIPIKHRVPTVGYIFIENDKPGSLDVNKAKEQGASGKQLGILKSGDDIILDNGVKIIASQVLQAPITGRKFAFLQDTYDASQYMEYLFNCDVMIHEATYDSVLYEKAIQNS